MNFRDTAEESAVRSEVRNFLAQELPEEWRGIETFEITAEKVSIIKEWSRTLAKRGWVTPSLPKSFGGAGFSLTELFVFYEEMALGGAPGTNILGTSIFAPVVHQFGTDEQKARFLPTIASGESWFVQLFSEPNAGSDLAGLSTRADREGDDFVVNGTKIWSSGAHVSDYGTMLVRTDPNSPKHKGMTYMVVDMKTEGIEVQPLINMDGAHSFNQVFFKDVRVPLDAVIGQVDKGWDIAVAMLDFERGTRGHYAGVIRRMVNELVEQLRGQSFDSKVKGRMRRMLSQLVIEAEVARLLAYRVVALQAKGALPSAEASEAKIFVSELHQRLTVAGLKLQGMKGLIMEEVGPGKASAADYYMIGAALTIAGGTSEIQRNIVAARGLGLPR